MISVYYDGKCGLCSREIRYYKRIANKDVFNWVDITENPTCLEKFGVTYKTALEALHCRDHQGNFHIGVDGFVLIWRHIPSWKFASYLIRLPIIYSLAKLAYKAFAVWRFRRLEHCKPYGSEFYRKIK